MVIRAAVPGIIDTVYVDEGQKVKEGKLLLNLDNRLEELELKRRKLIWKDKSQQNSTDIRIDIIGDMYNTTKSLYERSGSVSEDDLRKLELDYKLALSQAEQLRVKEKKEQIEYKITKKQYQRKQVRAPFSGVIAEIFLQSGDHCRTHQPLMHIANPEDCVLVCNVEETIANTFKMGKNVNLQIRSGGKWLNKEGRIVFRSPVVHSASGLVKVKAQFSNDDLEIIPGTKGRIVLQ